MQRAGRSSSRSPCASTSCRELGAHAGRAHAGRARRGRRRHLRDRRARRGVHGGVPRRAGARASPSTPRTAGMVEPAGERRRVGAGRRPDRRHPAGAGRASSRACVSVAAARLGRRADDGRRRGRLHRRDQERRRSSSPSAAAGVEPGAAALAPNTEPRAHVLDLRLARAPGAAARSRCSAELIDASSVGGAIFDLGSATYDMTRIVTGQLDAYLELGPRIVEERARAARASSSESAAARCSTTRPTTSPPPCSASRRPARSSPTPTARPLADRPLLGSGHEFQMSCVAPPTPSCTRRSARDRRGDRSARRGVELAPHRAARAIGRGRLPRDASGSRPRPASRSATTPTSSAAALVEEIRELAEPLEGQAGPARQRHRVRRRRLGDPLHARAADARRRPRRPLAGDLRPRGVLQRDQAPPQLAAGRPRRRSPTSSGSSSTRYNADERRGAARASGTRSSSTTRSRSACAAAPPEHGQALDLALPHRPLRAQPGADRAPAAADRASTTRRVWHMQQYVPDGHRRPRRRQHHPAGDRPALAEEHGASRPRTPPSSATSSGSTSTGR